MEHNNASPRPFSVSDQAASTVLQTRHNSLRLQHRLATRAPACRGPSLKNLACERVVDSTCHIIRNEVAPSVLVSQVPQRTVLRSLIVLFHPTQDGA